MRERGRERFEVWGEPALRGSVAGAVDRYVASTSVTRGSGLTLWLSLQTDVAPTKPQVSGEAAWAPVLTAVLHTVGSVLMSHEPPRDGGSKSIP